ncbi:MAG: hypothetical protein M1835_001995, partial [Candelina submexicana]
DRQSGAYSIHPVVHERIRHRLDADEHRIYANIMLFEAHCLFFGIEAKSSTRAACNALLRHITAAIDFAVEFPDSDVGLSDLSFDIARAVSTVNIHDAAIHLFEVSILALNTSDPPEKLCARRMGLALCLLNSGHSVRASAEAKACLAIVGENQLEDLISLLCLCLIHEARYSDATLLHGYLLAIRVNKYGEVSEEIARSKCDLATIINFMPEECHDNEEIAKTFNPTRAAQLCDEGIMILETLEKTS